MKTPSSWIAVGIGCIGAICGIASLIWTFYVYQREQPQFIIDCPLDFDKPGLSMGRGIPSNVYVYDNRIGGVTVPCTVINTGEKRELIRRIDSTLSFTVWIIWGQIFILDIAGWIRTSMRFLLKQTERKVKDKDLTPMLL